MSITIEIQGLDELIDNFENSEKIVKEESTKALKESVTLIRSRSRRRAGSPPIVYTGDLARSIVSGVKRLTGIVEAKAKHAAAVEGGTRPHFPPVAPLERWAQIKLGKPGLGFIIARKISRKGTKAQPYMEPAARESIRDVERFFDDAMSRVTARFVK